MEEFIKIDLFLLYNFFKTKQISFYYGIFFVNKFAFLEKY